LSNDSGFTPRLRPREKRKNVAKKGRKKVGWGGEKKDTQDDPSWEKKKKRRGEPYYLQKRGSRDLEMNKGKRAGECSLSSLGEKKEEGWSTSSDEGEGKKKKILSKREGGNVGH